MLSIAHASMPALSQLDEPSDGLAPMIVQQIVEVLFRPKSEGSLLRC
jgi:ABC-type branched-subunit amino acid transport system ATPase component